MTSTFPSGELNIAEEIDPKPETSSAIARGLDASNVEHAVRYAPHPLWIIARDTLGAVTGGLKAETVYSWCYVNWLWVDERWRRKGLGSTLVKTAEKSAASRGCVGIYLSTFSFQAPEFYRGLGYTEFARLD